MILYEKTYKETGKDYAYRVIKDNIMFLQLKPGDLISEADLAEKLNISRTPIREVIMRLKAEHLIEVKPQAGTYISLIDWNLIKEAIFMRYILEKEVLLEACYGFKEEIFMELEKNVFSQKLILDKDNIEIEFHRLDKEFHQLLFLGTNKPNVWNSIINISTHYNRMRLLFEMNKSKNSLVEQHEVYLNIIKNKELDKIDDVLIEHIKSPIKEWKKLLDDNEKVRQYIKNKK